MHVSRFISPFCAAFAADIDRQFPIQFRLPFRAADGANRHCNSPRDRLDSRPERSRWHLRSCGVFSVWPALRCVFAAGNIANRIARPSAPLFSPSLTDKFHDRASNHRPSLPVDDLFATAGSKVRPKSLPPEYGLTDYHFLLQGVLYETSNNEHPPDSISSQNSESLEKSLKFLLKI